MESKKINQKLYIAPTIECIKLDNCISLALQSSPPVGPDETYNQVPQYFNSEPFKNALG